LSGYFQPVRIRVPEGARIALAIDGQFTEPAEGDCLAGMLIGAVYRLQVAGIPNEPGVEVYPTIELIDRLYPPPGLALRFPIPIELTADELSLAAQGAFITRVIYVEDPLQALPVAEKGGRTQWIEAAPGDDPLVVADRLGRPIAILRIGNRDPASAGNDDRFICGAPPLELFDESLVPPEDTLPGGWPTYRLPCDDRTPCGTCDGGECSVGAACQACQACGFGDLIGPTDEYICDGGDFGTPVGVKADWTINGLEQEDAVAHYDTLGGCLVVVPSNRVCIYAPRFAAVRRLNNLMVHQQYDIANSVFDNLNLTSAREAAEPASLLQRHAVGISIGQRPPSLLLARQQPGVVEQLLGVLELTAPLAPYANLSIVRTGQVDNNEKPWLATAIESAVTWAGDQSAQVVIDNRQAVALVRDQQPGVVYESSGPNRPRLRLCKLASTGNALPGQQVEFTLRFDNIGDQVIGNVTIVDNLSTRLEYIPESAKSSLEADFFTQPNDAGSVVLRWEIKEPLEPGEGGILQFQCLVR
jgi:uncharacterized repeat protein (TIGR01451 family)